METLVDRAGGLDVHKASITACVRLPGANGRRSKSTRRFGTTTSQILALVDWLASQGVSHVAMESTGVYWKPVYYLLEEHFELLLVNAAHMKNVPGRKTDVNDAEWIAQLLEHGLLRASFVPPPAIRELRDLTRYRKAQCNERTRAAQRLEKVLQDAGVKLSSVASNILGVSGRAMIEALIAGTRDPDALAQLAKGKLRPKVAELREALRANFRPHHGLIAAEILGHVDYLDGCIDRLTVEIGRVVEPFAQVIEVLDTIPGINRRNAEIILAEIGADMSRFPTAGHLASWAGMCPGNNESAGKHRAGTTRVGSSWLRTALVEAANAAARSKNTFLSARYRRLEARRGHNRAAVAVGHSILVIAYHLILNGEPYTDLGADHYVRHHTTEQEQRRLVRRLEALGQRVTLEPMVA